MGRHYRGRTDRDSGSQHRLCYVAPSVRWQNKIRQDRQPADFRERFRPVPVRLCRRLFRIHGRLHIGKRQRQQHPQTVPISELQNDVFGSSGGGGTILRHHRYAGLKIVDGLDTQTFQSYSRPKLVLQGQQIVIGRKLEYCHR